MRLFTKPLSATDLEVRFSVPMESLASFGIPEGESALDFKAADLEGHSWEFRLKTREKDTHPKPVISAGWLAFVRHKRLRLGDVVELHKHSTHADAHGTFSIRALRKFNLLGQDIWLDVEQFH